MVLQNHNFAETFILNVHASPVLQYKHGKTCNSQQGQIFIVQIIITQLWLLCLQKNAMCRGLFQCKDAILNVF